MSLENFNQDLINQVDNDIFLNGNEPEEIEGSYCIFLFTKFNIGCNETWGIPNLRGNWRYVGSSWLGHWRENQFCGSNIDDLYHNEMLIRSAMNEYISRGVLTDFRIRYKFPTNR